VTGHTEDGEGGAKPVKVLHRHVQRGWAERPDVDRLMEIHADAPAMRSTERQVAVSEAAPDTDRRDPAPRPLDPPAREVADGSHDLERPEPRGELFGVQLDEGVLDAVHAEQAQQWARSRTKPEWVTDDGHGAMIGEWHHRPMHPTYHLVPSAVWSATDPATPYAAESLRTEGFIHCTDGVAELVATANRHYRADPRPFVVLTIDLDRVGAAWSIEDEAGVYPHVQGAIERVAIVDVRPMLRAPDGEFLGIG
jgi:uncharacterized protein (DUF952 family)